MKKILKIFMVISLIFITIISVIWIMNIDINENNVYAASSGSASDLQLMARAINGEARGEPYEGQVAVRSSYLK